MAKRRTGKRSVKRAFKKRRTIRKFRKTMRRYLQSGGINPAITTIGAFALALVLARSPKLMALLSLFGLVESKEGQQQGQVGGYGFGGLIGNIKQSIPTAAFGPTAPSGFNLASAINAAKSVASRAQTKTIAVSKDRVINSLNALKAAFNNDPYVDQNTKTNITKCVGQLVAKINQAPPSAPENVTSEDITTSVKNADDTTQAPSGETFDDMVKRVLNNKIDLLKTKYETAINARIESFKGKYNLGDADMNCINVLKNAVLSDLIKKKDGLMSGIMGDKWIMETIDKAKKGGEFLSAGVNMLKSRISQNPQATAAKGIGTAALSNENAKAALSKFSSLLGTKKP